MTIIKQIWIKLNDPVQLWGYSFGCIFTLLTAFTVETYAYPITFTILKSIVVLFSVFIYSKVISRFIKRIKKN